MTSYQTALEYARNEMHVNGITAAQANVLIVQIMGVREIVGRCPADVRKTLNEAVKSGELGHIKKEGLKPEVYHHKNARPDAIVYRRKVEKEKLESLKGVFA